MPLCLDTKITLLLARQFKNVDILSGFKYIYKSNSEGEYLTNIILESYVYL